MTTRSGHVVRRGLRARRWTPRGAWGLKTMATRYGEDRPSTVDYRGGAGGWMAPAARAGNRLTGGGRQAGEGGAGQWGRLSTPCLVRGVRL